MPDGELATLRGDEIGIVFQEPRTALNPIRTIGRQIAESVRIHEGLSRRDAARAGGGRGIPRRPARPRAHRRPLPASALRRAAAARGDRDGARVPAATADRRRADDGSGCHDPVRDPRPAARAGRGRRHVARLHHPRPRGALPDRHARSRARRRPSRGVRARLDAADGAGIRRHAGTAARRDRDPVAPGGFRSDHRSSRFRSRSCAHADSPAATRCPRTRCSSGRPTPRPSTTRIWTCARARRSGSSESRVRANRRSSACCWLSTPPPRARSSSTEGRWMPRPTRARCIGCAARRGSSSRIPTPRSTPG